MNRFNELTKPRNARVLIDGQIQVYELRGEPRANYRVEARPAGHPPTEWRVFTCKGFLGEDLLPVLV